MADPLDPSSLENVQLPHLLGRYLLQRLVGCGGMGLVFEAELQGPVGFRKQVALKVLRTPVAGTSAQQREELVGEARLGALLRHPNIVDTYELGEHEGRLFISLELIDGVSLQRVLKKHGRLPPHAALDVATQACAGLAHAHRLEVAGRRVQFVHRDLKPGNILITRDGLVKLVDFGISSALGVIDAPGNREKIIGTPGYMSPEQVRGDPLDARSDLFSLGVLLFRMLSGERLFKGRDGLHVLRKVLEVGTLLARPEVLAEAESVLPGSARVLRRCLSTDRESRYGTAAELADALQGLRAGAAPGPGLGDALNWVRSGDEGHGTPWRPAVAGDGSSVSEPSGTITRLNSDVPPAPRTNLASEQDRFVGREADLEALAARFEGGAQLVTLKGLGGAGKSRLAQHFSALGLEDFPGGVWWVDLCEARAAVGVLQATATALDVPLGGDDSAALATQLGHAIAARGAVLLVFDNFEQVVAHAPLTVGRWLGMAPEAKFLATSREPLKLAGEEVLDLRPLLQEDGIDLFELRARAAGARWKDTDESQDAIARIVRELDGLPLAIELAAARARLLSPTQLLARLEERFKLLRSGRRGVSDRQATLEGLIRWSWDLLEPWEQAALAQLSVFRGGFLMEAAEEVLDLSAWSEAPWSLDVVGSLLDKSLVFSRDVMEQPRFGMYASIRAYADDKLATAEPPIGGAPTQRGARLRHLLHYAQLGDPESLAARDTSAGMDQWLTLFPELENLALGVEAGLDSGHLEAAAGAARAAARALAMRGPYVTAVKMLEQLLAEPELAGELKLDLVGRYGWLLHISGRVEEAISVLSAGIEDAVEQGETLTEGRMRCTLGRSCQRHGRIEEAVSHATCAQRLASEVGDSPTEVKCLALLGDLHREHGEVDEALAQYERALVILRRTGNQRLEGQVITSLGGLYLEMGRLEESRDQFERSLSLARRGGNRRSEGIVLGLLGLLYTKLDSAVQALSHYEQGLEIVSQLGDRGQRGITLGNIGDMLIQHGDWHGAEERLTESIDILHDVYPVAAGAFRGSLSLVCANQGDFGSARALLTQAEGQLRGQYAFELAKLLCRRGSVESMAGDAASASAALAEAEAIASEIQAGPKSELRRELSQLREQLAGASA
jgi:serine/threonine protein kinase/predicted ATPase